MNILLADALISLVFLFFLATLIGITYRYRFEIKKFVTDREYGTSFQQDRKKVLKRKMEDAQDEITWLEERERKQKAETGE